MFGGEVVHLVVEQEAEAFGGDTRAEGVVEGGGDGDGVAFGIDDGIMRGVLGFVKRDGPRVGYAFESLEGRALQFLAHAGVVGIDGGAPGGGIFLVDELRYRDVGEIGVAQEVGAIEEGAAESLGGEVDRLGRTIAGFGEVEALENIEDFDKGGASGRRRRRSDDVVATIRAADRFALLYFIGGEVGGGDEASAFLDGGGQFAG